MTFDPKWNAKYAGPNRLFGSRPNDFLRSEVWRIPNAGRVLTIGEGDGRNAVWLAQQGFDVVGVEGSPVAVDKARSYAKDAGVAVEMICADLVGWDWPVGAFDAVAAIFVHFPADVRASVHARAAAALTPGGSALVECFHPNQAGGRSGGPPAGMLCSSAQLAADFDALTPILQLDGVITLDEGPRHQGPAHVARFIGAKGA